ncbi:serine/threonine-protein kinase [Anabaena sp. UHCC 0204]|uniref:serine/threonine-protein kinase n=1 Tax=Anabaena sp. UHCC 0204 TaxID=2590009 RepID=UPI00144640A1|nr:serine/threonine-protein kinase [Anabaena sp. UHCC 0204]MTJ07161.1 protein kinase [Anabaena sp. UHCC 0204]
MSFCTNCLYPQNPDNALFCLKCGKPLLLKDRYRPLYPLGKGGFGRTLLGVDEHIPSQPQCVIKQLCFPEENLASFRKAVELFRQEAVRLDDLRHPQIPQLLAHFEQENRLYLVQELISGQTLAQELEQQGVFNQGKIQKLLQDLLPVLEFVHGHHVIHRDIKPENIMRKSLGGDLVLIDFGVAKYISATGVMKTGTTIGSPEYMAPEQMRGKVLPASDLYSLGVSCIQLLTGISPFDLFDDTSDRWIWRDYLPPDNHVTSHLSEILDKLIHNALAQRYKSAQEVLAAMAINTQPAKKQQLTTLRSDTGINYQQLRDFLAWKQWQKADAETWALMCQALSKRKGSYLSNSDLETLPCQDLQIIDQLWTKYSQGHFGFSIQTQIYNTCDRDYAEFCSTVGWYLPNATSVRQQLTFKLSAPTGHLPSHFWVSGNQLGRHMKALTAKVASCYIRNN